MGRLLILALIVVLGVWLLKRALARAEGDTPRSSRPPEDLVRCAQCGVLVPRAEAREAGGATYCTVEHARLGPRAR